MNCWKEYIEYSKDNPEGYWFKRKLYGYGWTPARKQGWLVLGSYLIAVFTFILILAPHTAESDVTKNILLPVLGITIVFVTICWKTGEPPRWQWGKKSK